MVRRVCAFLLRLRPHPWQYEVAMWVLLALSLALVWQWRPWGDGGLFGRDVLPMTARDPRTCADFQTQAAAQAAYQADPERLRHLDRDGDALACEALP